MITNQSSNNSRIDNLESIFKNQLDKAKEDFSMQIESF